VCGGAWVGVEGTLGNVFRYSGLFYMSEADHQHRATDFFAYNGYA